MDTQSLYYIGTLLGGAAAFLTAVGAFANRKGIVRWFTDQATLIRYIIALEAELLTERGATQAAKRDAEASQQAATYWESTARAGRAMREDFNELAARVDRTQQVGAAMIKFIGVLMQRIGVLEQTLVAKGITVPGDPVVVPIELREELES